MHTIPLTRTIAPIRTRSHPRAHRALWWVRGRRRVDEFCRNLRTRWWVPRMDAPRGTALAPVVDTQCRHDRTAIRALVTRADRHVLERDVCSVCADVM